MRVWSQASLSPGGTGTAYCVATRGLGCSTRFALAFGLRAARWTRDEMPNAAQGFQKGRRDIMSGQQTTGATKDLERSHAYTAEHAGGDDHLLIAVTKAGDPNAFGALYERHRLKIYHTALRILRNEQDAEDAAQRSFQRAFTNLSGLREDSTFSTWLTRTAINEALMMLRQRRTTYGSWKATAMAIMGPPLSMSRTKDHRSEFPDHLRLSRFVAATRTITSLWASSHGIVANISAIQIWEAPLLEMPI